jgi:hypothetical protein
MRVLADLSRAGLMSDGCTRILSSQELCHLLRVSAKAPTDQSGPFTNIFYRMRAPHISCGMASNV